MKTTRCITLEIRLRWSKPKNGSLAALEQLLRRHQMWISNIVRDRPLTPIGHGEARYRHQEKEKI